MTPSENIKSLKSKNKNRLKAGSMHGNIEINDKNSQENLHNINL